MPIAAVSPARRPQLTYHDSRRVFQAAVKVFAATSASRRKVLADYAPAMQFPGDPAKGREVYLRACAACHVHGAEGRDIGPNLVSVVDHSPPKLLGAILDPSADIQPGYNAYVCTLRNGEQIFGLLVGETESSVTVRSLDGATRVVLRGEIASLQSQPFSLMPEGLEAGINPQGMADLIAFLRQHAP